MREAFKKTLLRVIAKIIICWLLVLLFPFQTLQASPATKDAVHIYYFYINTCESCREAEEVIDYYSNELKSNKNIFPVKFLSYNIVEQKNMQLLQEFCESYEVPEAKKNVPILFAGDAFYSGQNEITQGLDAISIKLKTGTMKKSLWTDGVVKGDQKIKESFNGIKIFNVLVVGLINGLNPCSLSMLLFFLSLLLAKQNLKIINIGMAFVMGKFLAYLLLGTVLYNFLQEVDMDKYQIIVKVFIAIFVIVMASLNIKDYFSAKQEKYGEIKNQLPSKIRKWNHKMITLFSQSRTEIGLILISGVLGMIVSVGEFLCTGQVYLTTILYILQSEAAFSMKAFSYLLLYSAAFAIPTMIIVVIISRSRKLIDLSEKVRFQMPLIKLLTAAALIVVGVIILFFT